MLLAIAFPLFMWSCCLAGYQNHESSWTDYQKSNLTVKNSEVRRALPSYYFSYYSEHYGNEIEQTYNYDNGEYYSAYYGYYSPGYYSKFDDHEYDYGFYDEMDLVFSTHDTIYGYSDSAAGDGEAESDSKSQ